MFLKTGGQRATSGIIGQKPKLIYIIGVDKMDIHIYAYRWNIYRNLLVTIEDLDKWLSQKHTIIHKAKAKFRLIDSPHWQDYLPINYFFH